MANEQISRRTRLSKGGWLLALIAIVLLYFLMLFVKSEPLDNDKKMPAIQQLSPEKLDTESINGTTVETEKKRPDLLPIEAPKNEFDADKSIQLAKNIEEDIPIIENLIEIRSYSAVKISIQTNETNGVRLSGVMPAQQNIDALYQATVDAFGKGKVINELTVGQRTAASTALDGIVNFMPTLKKIKHARLQIIGNTGHISGQVDSKQLKTAVLSQIGYFLTGKITDKMTFSNKRAVESVQLKIKKVLVEKQKMQLCQKTLAQIMTGKTILFESNKTNIDASSFALLGVVIKITNECIDNLPHAKIEISGYTDSRGKEAYNIRLSQNRAEAVKDYLVQTGHIKPRLIGATGYGKAQPIASNDTKEGRMRNRRITISIQ